MCSTYFGKLGKKNGFKGEKLKGLFWDVVKCPNEEQLKGKLKAIQNESIEAYQDLMNRDPKPFCRAYIEPWCKFDMIDNNICETFNSYIRKAREKLLLKSWITLENIYWRGWRSKLG